MTESAFKVEQSGEEFGIVCESKEDFYLRAETETSAYQICELLNRGFRIGYQNGKVHAQLAMQRALGL